MKRAWSLSGRRLIKFRIRGPDWRRDLWRSQATISVSSHRNRSSPGLIGALDFHFLIVLAWLWRLWPRAQRAESGAAPIAP